jgi:hypothetical protein
MMRHLLYALLPLIALALALGASAMWVFIKSNVHAFFKVLLIPCVITACVAIPLIFVTLMGYAVWLQPPAEFVVLGHNTIVKNNKKESIEVWLRPKDGSSRLYVIPYSKKVEQQLEEIRNGRKNGMEGRMKRKPGSTNRHSDQDESPYQMEMILPELPSKTPIEEQSRHKSHL